MVKARKSRCAMSTTASTSSGEEAPIKYVCGIDIGSQACAGCICRPDKSVVVKPITFTNAKEGWQVLLEKLAQLDAAAGQILIGMEATSRSGENLSQELERRGYRLCLLHPGQTHPFHRQQGLRGKHGPARCDDDCPRALERGSTCWLYPQRSGRHLSRTGALTYPALRRGSALSKRDPSSGGGALP
jgi:Transposase